jgi:hypothetical protein
MARQNAVFSRAYHSQTFENRPLNCKGFFRNFPNLIRVRMRPGAFVLVAARAAFW